MTLPRPLVTCLAGLLVAGAALAAGENGHCHPPAAATDGTSAESAPADAAEADPDLGVAVDLAIPATPLVDQDGHAVRFGPDLVEGKLVAINFVFTTCTTICPPMGANFGQLQKLLGERAGRDVHLVSVSIDPTVDTPERLAAWGERFGASDAWTLVTGDKPLVDDLLQTLGVFVAEKRFHSPIVLIGNATTGEWLRANGLTPAPRLLEQIDRLAVGATAASHDAHDDHADHATATTEASR